jgi:hypothetical protein
MERKSGWVGFLRHHFINLLGTGAVLLLANWKADSAAYLALGGVLGIANYHAGQATVAHEKTPG